MESHVIREAAHDRFDRQSCRRDDCADALQIANGRRPAYGHRARPLRNLERDAGMLFEAKARGLQYR